MGMGSGGGAGMPSPGGAPLAAAPAAGPSHGGRVGAALGGAGGRDDDFDADDELLAMQRDSAWVCTSFLYSMFQYCVGHGQQGSALGGAARPAATGGASTAGVNDDSYEAMRCWPCSTTAPGHVATCD